MPTVEEQSTKPKRQIAYANRNPDGDYPEDFEHENGMYQSVCVRQDCQKLFTGGKYRFICKACSVQTPGRPVGQGLE